MTSCHVYFPKVYIYTPTELSMCFHYQQVKTTPQKIGTRYRITKSFAGSKGSESWCGCFFRRGIGSQPLPFASMKIQWMLEMIGLPPV